MDAVLGIRLIFVFGLLNLLGLLALFLSCRCTGGMRPLSMISRLRIFTRFYRYHCYYWAVLWLSVVAHLTIAILLFGVPFGS